MALSKFFIHQLMHKWLS